MDIDALEYWNRVGLIALSFPGAVSATSYGTPAFKVHKKLFARLKEDGKTLVVFNDERDKWIKRDPGIFFITDHYRNYPMMLVNLAHVKRKDLKTLLLSSWQIQAPPALRKG
ncbi:MAG: MmcQ/YjbR family DNA-binding protein [Bacteroidota bacterium]